MIEEVDDDDDVLILHRGTLRAHNVAHTLREIHQHPTLAKVFANLTADNAPEASR
ncbi:hypothetical protein [Enterovibrio coralii]|uniref:hypothetical protein n=1 Tax=Enterovibrio coralii TaxID=294935 RepID=UPI001E3B588A|nr:hypothetical protein [Enterovibrio coralii]